jgi:hypothetical protein
MGILRERVASAVAESEMESDAIADAFLTARDRLDPDAFIPRYRPVKKRQHLRQEKLDAFSLLISE